jgi:hydrogenase maturation protein HypF
VNQAAHTQWLPHAAPARVLACGAYLKNRACLIDGDRAVWSAVHGDLSDAGSRDALEHSVGLLLAAARGPLAAVAHDLHPDFFSTRLALELAQQHRVPAIAVLAAIGLTWL